jgi:hypothetical protein
MSQSKESKKVVVNSSSISNLKATTSSQIESTSTTGGFLFGRKNFTIMLIGLALIGLGMLLMSGGSMPSSDVWDENIIYSTRRTLIAPLVILIGLGLQIYAIFAKK